MRLAEYLIECDHCDTETKVTVINNTEEPQNCSMCGWECYASFLDAEEDSDV